jgi:hypothetical protein
MRTREISIQQIAIELEAITVEDLIGLHEGGLLVCSMIVCFHTQSFTLAVMVQSAVEATGLGGTALGLIPVLKQT